MKEIKFRIYSTSTRRWYYSESSPEMTVKDLQEGSSGTWKVMQFTGLHDCNGREIYEGDIVEGAGGQGLIEDICTFVWLRCFSGNQKTYTNILDKKHWLHEMEGLETSEVIGNAHENKGLL